MTAISPWWAPDVYADRRRWALDRELEFNKSAAPDIYRAVRAVTRAGNGGLELDGPGEVLDYALEMRRFDDAGVLASNPSALVGPVADGLDRTSRPPGSLHRDALGQVPGLVDVAAPM